MRKMGVEGKNEESQGSIKVIATAGNPVDGEPKMTLIFDELERRVMTEMRKVYSEKAVDHAMRPRNVG